MGNSFDVNCSHSSRMFADFQLLVIFLMTACFICPTEACLALGAGGCQGLAGCPQPVCGGGCAPPPPPPPPPQLCCAPPPPPPPPQPTCNCPATQECGRFGCYTRRNRVAVASVKTRKLDKDRSGGKGWGRLFPFTNQTEPEIVDSRFPNNPANAKFMRCCEDRDLPDACLGYCTFQTYSRDMLNSMFLNTNACPLAAAADIHFCAAQGQDHRSCCAQSGVSATFAGDKCLALCDLTPGRYTQLDMSYLSCYDRFDSMKDCFYQSITAPQRRG